MYHSHSPHHDRTTGSIALPYYKDYEVACILNDICHMAMDYEFESLRDRDGIHMYAGFEDLYYDTIQNLDCYGTEGLTMEDFESYVWAY